MTIIDGVGVFFVIRSTRRDAECPRCGKRSRHLHTKASIIVSATKGPAVEARD